MKIHELIKWAEGLYPKERDLTKKNFLISIIDRAKKYQKATTDSEKWMSDITEYLDQLKNRGIVYGEYLQEGEPEPAKSEEVLRKDGLPSGGSTKG